MDRLADSSGPDGSYEYDYDLNGNRNWHKRNTVQTSYTYNAARTRLQALSGGVNETRLYDDSGNTTQIDGRDFDHNERNQLWRYQEGSVSIEYRHNAFGERQVKDDGATITRFVYDGPRLMHERTGASPRDYIYLEGQLVGLVQNGSLYFVHTDHLGRPEIVTNGAKSVRWSAQNNAFGNIPATDLIGGLHIAFPGQYYDIESGTYYNYFRTYDATTGRYLQSDPIGLAGASILMPTSAAIPSPTLIPMAFSGFLEIPCQKASSTPVQRLATSPPSVQLEFRASGSGSVAETPDQASTKKQHECSRSGRLPWVRSASSEQPVVEARASSLRKLVIP